MGKITSTLVGAVLMLSIPVIASAQYSNEAGKRNVVETAVAAGNFVTLTSALERTGLVEALSAAGPFTVFAPTDEAFAALTEEYRDVIMNDTDLLKRVLLPHVVGSEVTGTAALAMSGESTETLSGMLATISVADGKIIVNQATIVSPDIVASNGIIHIIDRVIIPIDVEMALRDMLR